MIEDEYWELEYGDKSAIWGNEPSELIREIEPVLRDGLLPHAPASVLDIGCGYGRDARYLAERYGYNVVGIDSSARAIEMARHANRDAKNISFSRSNLLEFKRTGFDLVFLANVYQTLRPNERVLAQRYLYDAVRAGGYLALNVLSVNDKEAFGVGDPVPGEQNSFIRRTYAHYFDEAELRLDFERFSIVKLYEHSYQEPHLNGTVHNHVSWMLLAQRPQI